MMKYAPELQELMDIKDGSIDDRLGGIEALHAKEVKVKPTMVPNQALFEQKVSKLKPKSKSKWMDELSKLAESAINDFKEQFKK